MKQFQEIALSEIRRPESRDRFAIDEGRVDALAQDVRENGLINPILVRKNADGYEVVAGERRFLAVQRLGWERVTCHVQDLDDKTAALLRAVENLGREDLSPVEEGQLYTVLMHEHLLSLDDISRRVAKSVGVVKRRMDLLNMPDELQMAIHQGLIKYGVAEELWRLSDPGRISYYLGFAVDHGATVAVVRQWVNDELKSQRSKASDVEGGGGLANPMQTAPTYIACDFCKGAVELGKDTLLRVCPDCLVKLREAGRG